MMVVEAMSGDTEGERDRTTMEMLRHSPGRSLPDEPPVMRHRNDAMAKAARRALGFDPAADEVTVAGPQYARNRRATDLPLGSPD